MTCRQIRSPYKLIRSVPASNRIRTFLGHWLHRLLFFNAPLRVFTVCYTAFGLAVIASWWFVRLRGGAGIWSVQEDVPVSGGLVNSI